MRRTRYQIPATFPGLRVELISPPLLNGAGVRVYCPHEQGIWTPARHERGMRSPKFSPIRGTNDSRGQAALSWSSLPVLPSRHSAFAFGRLKKDLKEQGPDGLAEFALRSDTLRCRACNGESVYTQADVIDLDGAPRKRGGRRANHCRSLRSKVSPD